MAIEHVLEDSEPFTSELVALWKEIGNDEQKYDQVVTAIQQAPVVQEAFDYYSEELVKAMEEAVSRLEMRGGETEARATVSVIKSHSEAFDVIATSRARELYKEFCLIAKPKPAATPQHDHFNQQYTEKSLRKVFDLLVDEKFLSRDYNTGAYNCCDDWLYAHTGSPDPTHNKLVWLGTQSALHDLIDLMYDETDEHSHQWAVTANCFYVLGKNGNQKAVNVDSIKNQSGQSRKYNTIKQIVSKLEPMKS